MTPPGTFVIHADGTIEVPPGDYDADQVALRFSDIEDGALIEIDVDNHPIACGGLEGETLDIVHRSAYQLPLRPAPGAILLVRTFHTRPGDTTRASEIAKTRASLATDLGPAERDQLRRDSADLADANRKLHALLLDASAATLDQAITAVGAARDTLVGSPTNRAIPDCDSASWEARPLAQALCEERRQIAAALDSIAAVLISARPAATPDAASIAKRLLDGHLDQLLTQIAVKPALTGKERTDHCKAVAQLRWLVEVDRHLRLVTRAEIPYVARGDLVVAHYGESGDVPTAPTSRGLVLLVLDAPAGLQTSFAKRQGNLVSTDITGLLATLVPGILRATPGGPFFATPFAEIALLPDELVAPVASGFSRICARASVAARDGTGDGDGALFVDPWQIEPGADATPEVPAHAVPGATPSSPHAAPAAGATPSPTAPPAAGAPPPPRQ